MSDTHDSEMDKELGRWQEEIRALLCKHAPAERIDGAGCESGDPLDFTLAEIGQALAFQRDIIDETTEKVAALYAAAGQRKCEGCLEAATTHDPEGTPLCAECAKACEE